MNTLQVFDYKTVQVRTVQKDGEIWFVAKDIAEALEYAWNGTECIRHVPAEWRGISSVLTTSGTQNMAVLSEQGLYFFLGRSDKTAALAFQKWIAGEVLPSIRKSGAYRAMPKTYLEALETLVESEKEKQRLRKENAAMKPKAAYHDRLIDRGLLTNFRDAAKELDIPEREFIATLEARHYIYRNKSGKIKPYAEKMEYFAIKDYEHNGYTGNQTFITIEGKKHFGGLFEKGNAAKKAVAVRDTPLLD